MLKDQLSALSAAAEAQHKIDYADAKKRNEEEWRKRVVAEFVGQVKRAAAGRHKKVDLHPETDVVGTNIDQLSGKDAIIRDYAIQEGLDVRIEWTEEFFEPDGDYNRGASHPLIVVSWP